MNEKERICHFCCLFARKCSHQVDIYHSANLLSNRNEKNSNAMSSINEIWKTEATLHSSPLYDLPLCFCENFSSNQRTFIKVWQIELLNLIKHLNSIRAICHHDNHLKVSSIVCPVHRRVKLVSKYQPGTM